MKGWSSLGHSTAEDSAQPMLTAPVSGSRGRLCFLFWPLSCMMRTSGRPHTLSTPPTFWTKMVNYSGEMPSCPFLQVQPSQDCRWATRNAPALSKACKSLCSLRSENVPGRKSGQDGGLPLFHLPPAAVSFHSSTRHHWGRAGPDTSCGLNPQPCTPQAVRRPSSVKRLILKTFGQSLPMFMWL